MIEEAEESGVLAPGQTVVELTSGNTGTGLAIVCGVKGYPFVAVMSRGNSAERAVMMGALGAEVILVDQMEQSQHGHVSGEDLALVEAAAQRITNERAAFRADQFLLPGNAAAMAGKETTHPGHRIQGGGYAMRELTGVETDLVDGYVEVSDIAAVDAARRLARLEGIFAGFSSGACVAAAEQLLRTDHPGATIGVVLADSGMKYLSTDLWS